MHTAISSDKQSRMQYELRRAACHNQLQSSRSVVRWPLVWSVASQQQVANKPLLTPFDLLRNSLWFVAGHILWAEQNRRSTIEHT